MSATEGAIRTELQSVRAPASLEWRTGGKNTFKPLTLNVQFLEHHKTQYLDLHRELQKIDFSQQTQPALQNFKVLLLLEIQLLLGCDVEWSVTPPPDSADPPVLSTAGDDTDADDFAEEVGSSGCAALPTRTRTRAGGGAATATP